MPAGTGTEIKVTETKVRDIKIKSVKLKADKNNLWAVIDGEVKIVGCFNAENYYYGTGDMCGISMTVTNIIYDLSDDDLAFEYIAKENRDFYHDYFDVERDETDWDFSETYKQLAEIVIEDEIDTKVIERWLYASDFDCEDMFGGGWSLPTFDGVFEPREIEDAYVADGAVYTIDDKYAVDYINKAIRGQNIQYRADYQNGDSDYFDTVSEAVDSIKESIEDCIRDNGIEDVYLDEYTVSSEYHYWGDDLYDDYPEVVYRADQDPDFDYITEWQEENL